MLCKARTLLLGLVALMLMGSVLAGTAYAEAGPFFYGREAGSEGVGEKLANPIPEKSRAKAVNRLCGAPLGAPQSK